MASSLSKNTIENSSFGNISGDLRIGDGLDEKETIKLLAEANKKQLEEIKNSISDMKDVQNQEIQNIIKKELQQQNLVYEFDILNKHFGSDIDEIREDIDNNNVDSALKRLLKLKEKNWDEANSEIKFRILTNIGVIYSKIEKNNEASEQFIEAYKVLPDNPKAINNVGVAFILQNKVDPDIFHELQQKSLEIYTSLDIRFNKKEQTVDEIEFDLPSEFLENENILMSLANHAHYKAEPDKAISYCKKALEISNTVIHQENLANSIFIKFQNFPQLAFKYSNKTNDKAQINEAIELYEKCWTFYQNGEIKKYKGDIKAKQAILYALLGNIEDAENAIEIALQQNDKDKYFLKYKSQILVLKGKNEDAIKILKSLDFTEHPDASISLSICYLQLNYIEEAIKTLRDLINQTKNELFKKNAIGFLLNIFLSKNSLSEAEDLISETSETIDSTNELLLDKCRFLFKKGEKEIATQILEKVISESNTDNQKLNYLIAQVYEELEEIEKAIEYYSKNTDLTQYNDLTNRIANLYLKINREDEALNLFIKIREHCGVIKGLTRNEISLHIHKGDLPKAKEIADLYLANYSDDIELNIHLAVINTRLHHINEVEHFLNQDIDCTNLDIKLIEIYLDLLAKNSLRKKAYEILYKLWNIKRSHLFNDFLIKFNMSYPVTNEVAEYSELVKENYAVKVRDGSGNFHWFIITNKEDVDLFPNEINKKSQYYILLGRKKGNRITIKSDPIDENVEIIEIKHKFDYILTKAFEKVGTDYKGKSLFKMFSTDKIHEIIEIENNKQKERGEIEKEYLQKYNDKQLPLHFFTKLFNVSPIRIWYDFTSSNKIFQSSLGLQNEIENSINIFDNQTENVVLFVDIYTLLTIYNLPSKDLIVKHLLIKTAQLTFDIIEDFINELRSGLDFNSMRLFFKDNVKYKIDEPMEAKRETFNFFESMLRWLKINISVEPSDLFLKKNHKNEDLYIDVFGKSTYYAILLAKENYGIAYIDDFVSRDILCREFGVQGIWTQGVINYLIKSRVILNVHNDTIQLAQFNYRHTSISVHTLYESYKQAKYKNRPPFTKVSSILQGNVSSNIAVVIGITFLFNILKDTNLPFFDRKGILLHIISELLMYRALIEVYELTYILLLKELINSPDEVDFIFAGLREYLSYFKLDKVIEEHPVKYRHLRSLALQAIRMKEDMKNEKL